jgi:hypothetical protein
MLCQELGHAFYKVLRTRDQLFCRDIIEVWMRGIIAVNLYCPFDRSSSPDYNSITGLWQAHAI